MEKCACLNGGFCDVSHNPATCVCEQCRTAEAASAPQKPHRRRQKPQEEKIFFFARGPVDDPTAWAEMWSREKAAKFVKDYLAEAGLSDAPWNSVRIERHKADGEFRILSWGEKSPSTNDDYRGERSGLIVELDGKEAFSSMKEKEED